MKPEFQAFIIEEKNKKPKHKYVQKQQQEPKQKRKKNTVKKRKKESTIALVNNFGPKSGIGKYAFNLLERAGKQRNMEMIYLESEDNPLKKQSNVHKVTQKINLPFFNKSFSWAYYFPSKIPKGYDVYHLTSQFLARVAKYRKPCIVTHMDLAPLLYPKEYPVMMRLLLKKVLPWYSSMKEIITISENSKQELVDAGYADEDKVTVIPPGFDEKIFKPMSKKASRKKMNLPLGKKIILNIGSEEPRKKIPCLLRATQELQKQDEDVLLVRVGNTEPQYAEQKKKMGTIELHNVPEADLSALYNAADLFLFPATYPKGFSYPPIEAMACGTPTIVSQELSVFHKGAAVVDVTNQKKVVEQAASLLFDTRKNKKWAQKALQASKEFTINKQIQKTLAIYDRVL